MKAKIKAVEYKKEYTTKYGTMYLFRVDYDDKTGWYSSKSKDQKKFTGGQEAEFTETVSTNDRGEDYITIKPIYSAPAGNFGKAVKKEQSRYSGFAMSYAKDLVVAGKIEIKQIEATTKKLFQIMVDLDKTLND